MRIVFNKISTLALILIGLLIISISINIYFIAVKPKSNQGLYPGQIIPDQPRPSVSQEQVKNINSFEECANAGYPVKMTYPEICSLPDGRTFSKSVTK